MTPIEAGVKPSSRSRKIGSSVIEIVLKKFDTPGRADDAAQQLLGEDEAQALPDLVQDRAVVLGGRRSSWSRVNSRATNESEVGAGGREHRERRGESADQPAAEAGAGDVGELVGRLQLAVGLGDLARPHERRDDALVRDVEEHRRDADDERRRRTGARSAARRAHHSSGTQRQRDGAHERRPQIMTWRLRMRSIQAPAGSPTRRKAATLAALSTPTSNSLASSSSTASTGMASSVICAPNWLSACPLHMREEVAVAPQRPRGARASRAGLRHRRDMPISLRRPRDSTSASSISPSVRDWDMSISVRLIEDVNRAEILCPASDPRGTRRGRMRALSSPLRLRVLRLCAFESRTNKELAELLGVNPGTMLHHVRTLVQTGYPRGRARAIGQPGRPRGAVPRDRAVVADPDAGADPACWSRRSCSRSRA